MGGAPRAPLASAAYFVAATLSGQQDEMRVWPKTYQILGTHYIWKRGRNGPGKGDVVMDWSISRTIKALRGFLGLTRYYTRFISDYGKIVRPLTDLLKQVSFPDPKQYRSHASP